MMKNRLFNNLGLKIAALVLAFLVWMSVVNVNDPVITRTITGIPVTTTNTSYLESLGLSSRLAGGNGTVSVTVSGNRSVVERITKENIKAEADLTQILSMDADPIMVPVSVSITGISGTSGTQVSSSPHNIEITVEEMEDADFIVTPTTGETRLPVTTKMVGSMTADPESITITGPGSVIGIIDRVTAPVNVSRLFADSVIDTDLQIYDKNGALFTESQMDSLKFSVTDGVSVAIDLWDVVSDISLKANVSGVPGTGFRVSEIYTTPSLFSVGGTEAALAQLRENGNTIEIPEEMLDVDGAVSDQEFRIDLTQILPSGIRLADNTSATAIINIEILPLDSRSFDLATVNIEQKNLAEGYAAIFQGSKLRIRVQGYGERLADLEDKDIKAEIDLSGLNAGTHKDLPVGVILPEGLTLIDPVTATVEIAKIAESSSGSSAAGSSAASSASSAAANTSSGTSNASSGTSNAASGAAPTPTGAAGRSGTSSP